MADIFISYARGDRATAEKLAQALIACGWSVWWDRHIPAGRRFDEVIAEQLSSASCVLVLWSRNGIQSEWVMEEAETARTRGMLVPAMIEAVQLPMGFRRIHAADLIGWNDTASHTGFEQLLIDIASVIDRQRRQHAAVSLQPFPESAPERVPPETETSEAMRTVDWTAGASGVREAEDVAAANDGAVDRNSPAFPSFAVETAWDAAAIEAIENNLTHFIGPVAKVVVSRAMQKATDLESLCAAVACSIPLDADRRQFLIRLANLGPSRPLSIVNGGKMAKPLSGSVREYPDPLAADVNLGEIEQALARYIGPIAKVVLKRAMAKGATRNDLCERLATHIEREDERRQFLATLTRGA
jgi:hypothetical protein